MKSSFLRSLKVKFSTIHTCLNLTSYISILLLYGNDFWLYEIVLVLEENPIPKPSSFFIGIWTVSLHITLWKYQLLRAYIYTHKSDVIYFSETFLDSGTSDDDDNAVYNLIRADHPFNTKQGGGCIYYKHSLAFRLLNIHYLKGCINFEILFGGKIFNIITLYRWPSKLFDKVLQVTSNWI